MSFMATEKKIARVVDIFPSFMKPMSSLAALENEVLEGVREPVVRPVLGREAEEAAHDGGVGGGHGQGQVRQGGAEAEDGDAIREHLF